MAGTIGFLGLIGSAVVMGAVFARAHQRRWSWFCRVTAFVVSVAIVYLALGIGGVWANLLFIAALLLTWVWLSMLSAHLYKPPRRPTRPEPGPDRPIPAAD